MTKLLLCAVLLAACGGGTKTAPTTPTTPTADKASASALTITALKFYQGDKLGVKLAADGTVSAIMPGDKWTDIGKLATDGTITTDGKLVAKLEADGTIGVSDPKTSGVKPTGLKVEGTTLVAGDKQITIDAKGTFVGGNPEMSTLRVEGLTDDGSKRAALLMLGVMSLSAEPSAKPADVKSAKPE